MEVLLEFKELFTGRNLQLNAGPATPTPLSVTAAAQPETRDP